MEILYKIINSIYVVLSVLCLALFLGLRILRLEDVTKDSQLSCRTNAYQSWSFHQCLLLLDWLSIKQICRILLYSFRILFHHFVPCVAVQCHRPSARGHWRLCNSSCRLVVMLVSDGRRVQNYWIEMFGPLSLRQQLFFFFFLPGILSRLWRGWARFFHICRWTVFQIKHKPSSAASHAHSAWEASPLPSLGCLETRRHKNVLTHLQSKSMFLISPDPVVFIVFLFMFKIWDIMRHFQCEYAVCKHGCSPSVQLASDIPRSVNSLSVNIAGGLRFPLPMGSSLKKSQWITSSWPSSWISNSYNIKKK